MKTDLAKFSETFELIPTGLKVDEKTLSDLADIECAFQCLDRSRRQLSPELAEGVLGAFNLHKRFIGEEALRRLGLDPAFDDFTIDEDTGAVYRCLRRS